MHENEIFGRSAGRYLNAERKCLGSQYSNNFSGSFDILL